MVLESLQQRTAPQDGKVELQHRDPGQRQNSDRKHQVWPQWLSKAKSCRCQSHSLKPQLTCSDGPQHGLRWSTQPVDEAELAAGRV
eukprot:scaffold75895_cov74-Phaeocystis_antarctica.AAC.2